MSLTIEVESCDYHDNEPPRQRPGPDKRERPGAGGGVGAARPRGVPPAGCTACAGDPSTTIATRRTCFLGLYCVIILSLCQILFSKSLHDSIHSRNTSSGARHYLMSGSSGHVVCKDRRGGGGGAFAVNDHAHAPRKPRPQLSSRNPSPLWNSSSSPPLNRNGDATRIAPL